jgi:D-sedoheptulose 7-phosphate isomerase
LDLNKYINSVTESFSNLDHNEISKLIELLIDAYNKDRFVFIIGNGGSAANASHFAQDLAKGTKIKNDQKKRLKALSLTDNLPFVTAQGNDEGYESIFVEQLKTYAKSGDLLIAISGSGNSPNIIKAIEWANSEGIITAGITGFDGGKLKKLAKHSVNVRLNDMCTSETIHSFIFHYIILELLEKLKELQ